MTSRSNLAPIADNAEDSDAMICVLPSTFSPITIGLNPFGSRAAKTEESSERKVKQYDPTISFFKIDNALPRLPFSEIRETRRCATTKVSLACCGVNEHPPTILESSSTLEIVPLCAIHRSFTFSGWAFCKLLLPIVEYLT